MQNDLLYCHFPSPLGEIFLAADTRGLVAASFSTHLRGSLDALQSAGYTTQKLPNLNKRNGRNNPIEKNLTTAVKALERYFKGDLRTLREIKISPHGTDFQRSVWKAMRKIKPGDTLSYGELAKRIGKPKASRAVGGACNKNPIILAIPCHRVVGKDGSLTGFAAGMKRKASLLQHEGAAAA